MDSTIKVPREALEGAQSFAIDFGGSVLKLVYTKKDEIQPSGFTIVHTRSFARADFQEALDFIKKECEISPYENGSGRTYIFTGVGTHQFQHEIRDQLKIRFSAIWEEDCFKEAFKLLMDNSSDEDLFHVPIYKEDEELKELVENYKKLSAEFGCNYETHNAGEVIKSTSRLPCLMAVLGSVFSYKKILEDGTLVEGMDINRGGSMFLGLGSLLTGAKTYEELIELAEVGNDRCIHGYSKDFIQQSDSDEGNNIYGDFRELDMLCFSFGRCLGKPLAEFGREDLARAVLVMTIHDIIQYLILTTEKLKVSKVIVVGGFAQAPVARRMIEEEFTKNCRRKAVEEPTSPMANATLRVMKAGSHLGALGAMLQSKPKPEVLQDAAAK